MTKMKSTQSKTNQSQENQFEFIDLDLVKSEPDDTTVPQSTSTVAVAKSHIGQDGGAGLDFIGNPIVIAPQMSPRGIGKSVVPVAITMPTAVSLHQSNYSISGSGGQPSKTFLLINNRSGNVQPMLLGGSSGTGRKPQFSGTAIIEPSQLPQLRVRTSMGLQAIVSTSGPRTSSFVVAQQHRPAETVVSNAMGRHDLIQGSINMSKAITALSALQSRPLSTPTDVIFTSRSIDPDGTVKTTKEFLCNFCQFKVSVAADFEVHKSTHVFSCNHCTFKAFTRYEVLKHKKEKHPEYAEELAGYVDLDRLMQCVAATFGAQRLPSPLLNISNVVASHTAPSSSVSQIINILQRVASPEPPHLELQNASNPPTMSVLINSEKSIQANATNNPKAATETVLDDGSKRSDSRDSAQDLTTKNSSDVPGDKRINKEPARTRPSRPRRAVAERKQTLKEVDSDSQGEANKTDDDGDWEEKSMKNRKKNKRDLRSSDPALIKSAINITASVTKTPEVLKVIPQQQQAQVIQNVQPKRMMMPKYKCPTCPFEATDAVALSNHAKNQECIPDKDAAAQKQDLPSQSSNTTLNTQGRGTREANPTSLISKDGMPSVLSTIHWSCYYCNLSSASQATVVNHVMKSHPGKAIQLKRISVPTAASAFLQQLQQSKPVTSTSASNPNLNQTLATQQTSDQANKLMNASRSSKPSNNDNEGCLWGCYYCTVQSIDRSEVITHLKKEHSDLKLIVTRRRITHIPATLKVVPKEGDGAKSSNESVSFSTTPGNVKEDDSSKMSNINNETTSEKPRSEGKLDNETPAATDKNEEMRSRGAKRKHVGVGNKRKKSPVSVSSVPRVLRSRKVSPGSRSPSLRDASPSHGSINSSGSLAPTAKRRRLRHDGMEKGNFRTSLPLLDLDSGEIQGKLDLEKSDKNKSGQIVTRDFHEYSKSNKSRAEESKWNCYYCDFTAIKSKVFCHIVSNHPDKPIKYLYLASSEPLKPHDSVNCSKLRGPRSVREMNLLRNGNWLWQCPLCGRRHVSKGYLNVHLKVAHPKRSSTSKELFPIRKCKPVTTSTVDHIKECYVSLVPAEEMVHYDSLSTLLLDNGLSLVTALDVDDDLDCDVVRHRKYKCSRCVLRGFRPMIVKRHFLTTHSATEVAIIDLKKSQKIKNGTSGDGCLMYSCLRMDCKFFANNKSTLESHYIDFHDHNRMKHHRMSSDRKRDINIESIGSSDASDSEVTLDAGSAGSDNCSEFDDDDRSFKMDQSFNKSHSKIKSNETMEWAESASQDMESTSRNDHQEHSNRVVTSRSAENLPTTSSETVQKNIRVAMLAKNSDFVSGLSLLKKTLSTTQVMTDMKRLNKNNDPDDHPQAATDTAKACLDMSSSVVASSSQSLCFNLSGSVGSSISVNLRNADINSKNLGNRPPQRKSGTGQQKDHTNDGEELKSTVDGKLIKKPKQNPIPKYTDRYHCALCGYRTGHILQMKQHLATSHNDNWSDKAYCIDLRARELRKKQKIIFCLREECAFYCKSDLELSAHKASPGECPLPLNKTLNFGNDYCDGQLSGDFSDLPSSSQKAVHMSDAEESVSQKISAKPQTEDAYWNKDNPKCNKSYQCSYCTFTTLDLSCIKSHVTTQHKLETVSCSSSLASVRRAGFSEIATEITSDGSFVTSVNDREVEDCVEDTKKGFNSSNSKSILKRLEVCSFGSNLKSLEGNEDQAATMSDLPGADGGKVYTVL